MQTGGRSIIRWLALVIVGAVPIAAAGLAGIERTFWALSRPKSRSRSPTVGVAVVGLALLVLPQLVIEGLAGETLWIGISSASLVLAIYLASMPRKQNSFGLRTLLVSAVAMAAPALWRLVASENFMPWWVTNTNVWASLAAMAATATVPLYREKVRSQAVTILFFAAILVAAATGSRTALLAIAAGVVTNLLMAFAKGAFSWRGAVIVVVGLVPVGALVLLSPLGSRLVGSVHGGEGNLVLASEELGGKYWTLRGVAVRSERGSEGLNWFRITSLDGRALDRVHQRFVIPPMETRTLSLDYRQLSAGGGVVAFAEGGGSMVVPFSANSEVSIVGNPTLVDASSHPAVDGWTTFVLTVRNSTSEPLVWRVGLSPNLRNEPGAVLDIRQVRMTRAAEVTAYVPTYAESRVRELASLSAGQRLGYAQGVIGLLAERPLFGHGSARPFYVLLDDYSLQSGATASNRPLHAHSLMGDVLVRFGAVGLVGLLAIVACAVCSLPQGRRLSIAPLLVVMFILGLGDATFISAGGPFVLSYLLLAMPYSNAENTPSPISYGR